VDIVDRRFGWGKTNENLQFWRALGTAIKQVNDGTLDWGGNWFKKGQLTPDVGWDPSHVELK